MRVSLSFCLFDEEDCTHEIASDLFISAGRFDISTTPGGSSSSSRATGQSAQIMRITDTGTKNTNKQKNRRAGPRLSSDFLAKWSTTTSSQDLLRASAGSTTQLPLTNTIQAGQHEDPEQPLPLEEHHQIVTRLREVEDASNCNVEVQKVDEQHAMEFHEAKSAYNSDYAPTVFEECATDAGATTAGGGGGLGGIPLGLGAGYQYSAAGGGFLADAVGHGIGTNDTTDPLLGVEFGTFCHRVEHLRTNQPDVLSSSLCSFPWKEKLALHFPYLNNPDVATIPEEYSISSDDRPDNLTGLFYVHLEVAVARSLVRTHVTISPPASRFVLYFVLMLG